jgi:hemin uptake protein HemP
MSTKLFDHRADGFHHSPESGTPESQVNFLRAASKSGIDGSMVTGEKKPRIESSRLFQGKSEVVIVHQDEEYNLRITRNGKLILTK